MEAFLTRRKPPAAVLTAGRHQGFCPTVLVARVQSLHIAAVGCQKKKVCTMRGS